VDRRRYRMDAPFSSVHKRLAVASLLPAWREGTLFCRLGLAGLFRRVDTGSKHPNEYWSPRHLKRPQDEATGRGILGQVVLRDDLNIDWVPEELQLQERL